MIQLQAVGITTTEYVGSLSSMAQVSYSVAIDDDQVSDSDDEPGDVDDNGECVERLLEDDDEDDIVDKVPLMFFFDIE